MGLSAVGRKASTTIIGGAYQMWQMNEPLTALIVLFCALIAPVLYLLCLFAVLLAMRRPRAPYWVGVVLRAAQAMTPWAMLEVMLLGILVALIKIAELAMVNPGIGLFSVGLLVVLVPAISMAFDPESAWRRIRWDAEEAPVADGHQP
jgi:paraquat-inducible protein A